MNFLVPALGAFASGMFPAIVASVLVFYAVLPGVSVSDLSLVASISFFGKVVASVCGGWLSDRLGRIGTIRLAGVLSVAGSVLSIGGGRFFGATIAGMGLEGFALGIFSIVLPLHLIETQPDECHGRISAGYQFSNTVGLLAGAFVGMLVAAKGSGPSDAIRMDLLSFLPVAVLFLGLSFGLTGGRRSDEAGSRSCSWRPFARPIFRAVALLSLTSAMGVGVITCSAVFLLRRAGLKGISSNGIYLATGFVSLVAAGLSGLVQKRASRLTVLRIGSVGAAVSLVLMSIAFARLPPSSFAALLLLYMGFFVFGPGAAAWTIAGDLLPQEIRAKGMSLSLLANQLVTAALMASFLPLAVRVGYTPVFLFFALSAVGYVLFVRTFHQGDRPCVLQTTKTTKITGIHLA